jgi:D-glycero-D-manno-heptose 1,7-bisphosphate phosphatase
MNTAIFLDRDGAINEDVGYFCSPDRLKFIPGAIEALRMLQNDFLLFIITNQSGIGKGVFSEEEFSQFNDYFKTLLKNEGIGIEHIYYCPHTKEENCICHKPKPYFLKRAEKDYDIDLKNSYVIGDHPHDMEMAHQVGANSVYLLTGHGIKHKEELELSFGLDFIANDIYEAAVWIMRRQKICKGGW